MIESARFGVAVTPLRDDVVGAVERVLWVLLGSVGCILVIACANVANLFLVRAERRQREVAVRTALGATRGDVVRLFLGESLALALAGGLLGLGAAWAGVRLLVSLRPPGIPRLEEIGVDGRVLLFTLLLSLAAGLLCGGLAALRFGVSSQALALREGGRGGTAGRERHRARNVLVVAQVAVALVLLVGSGLMVKSFWRLRNVNPGFDPRGVLTVRLDLPAAVYRDTPATLRFVQQLLERVRSLPGVTGTGIIYPLPLSGGNSSSGYWIEDFPPRRDEVWPQLGTRFASPGYFAALGIPVIAGQVFDRLDPARPSTGVVVSQGVAERFWPGQSPLGKRLTVDLPGKGTWYTIIGVVGNVHDHGLEDKPAQSVYFPMVRLGEHEWAPRSFSLVVRGRLNPRALVAPVRGVVRALDTNLALAQLLGSVGIYGVISYVVSQRTREIGVRMALGARRADISRMVLRAGLGITLLGIAIGLAGALALTRLLVALLYGVSPTDLPTFAAVPVMLAAVALLASWLPARRAAAVEPLEAIRYE
jgi:putative ABC transport system permease protein